MNSAALQTGEHGKINVCLLYHEAEVVIARLQAEGGAAVASEPGPAVPTDP